ncbi:MAG: DUF349 domain-containing protein [Fodinibius sp.]|nr:DUF349 domain-containing protein [Fodinibius sp.]
MNTTMEDIKKESDIIHESEYVFLTDNNELFLKEDWQGNARKLGNVSEEELEAKISELKEAFEELEGTVEETIASDVDTDELDALVEKIQGAVAVGNFGALKNKIEDKRAALANNTDSAEQEMEAEETPADEEQQIVSEDIEESAEENSEAQSETSEAEDETSEEDQQPEAADEEVDEESVADEDTADDKEGIAYYEDIVEKAQDLAKQTDWPYVSMELDNLSHEWSDGPDAESDEVARLYQKFNDAVEEFEQRKQEHYEKLDKQKVENLETKKKLLEEFEGIISNETWTATRRVNQMKGQWNSTGPLPSDKGEGLDERFEELLDIFNDHKVDRLVQQRQKRKII